MKKKWFSYRTFTKCSVFKFQIQEHSASPSHLEHLKQQNPNKQKLSQLVHIFISGQILPIQWEIWNTKQVLPLATHFCLFCLSWVYS